MENQTQALQIQDHISTFEAESLKLQKLDKSIQLISALKDIGPLIKETLDVANNVFESCIRLQEMELRLDFKLADNRERRSILLRSCTRRQIKG